MGLQPVEMLPHSPVASASTNAESRGTERKATLSYSPHRFQDPWEADTSPIFDVLTWIRVPGEGDAGRRQCGSRQSHDDAIRGSSSSSGSQLMSVPDTASPFRCGIAQTR